MSVSISVLVTCPKRFVGLLLSFLPSGKTTLPSEQSTQQPIASEAVQSVTLISQQNQIHAPSSAQQASTSHDSPAPLEVLEVGIAPIALSPSALLCNVTINISYDSFLYVLLLISSLDGLHILNCL